MRIFHVSQLWRPERIAKISDRKITRQNEKAEGFPSKTSKVTLAWKRTNRLVEVRFRAEGDIRKNDAVSLALSQSEVLLLASRLTTGKTDAELVQAIRKAEAA